VTDDFDRTPPNDLDAERAALGGMLMSADAARAVADIIGADDHYRPAHQIIHGAVLDLIGRGEPADAVSVAAELTRRDDIGRMGGAPYLHTLLASVPTAANAAYYARIIRERATFRRLVEAGTRIAQIGYQGHGDAEDALDLARAQVAVITASLGQAAGRDAGQIFVQVMDEIEKGKAAGLTTGLADLDEFMSLDPGDMVVIAARPSVGKSVLGLNIAQHVAIDLGLPVYYWSGEMSANALMTRLIAAEAGVNLSRLLHRQLDEGDWRRIAARSHVISSAPLTIDDTRGVPIGRVRSELRRMQLAGQPAAVAFLDYLGLFKEPDKAESRQRAVSAMSLECKQIAGEFGIPLVVLHQLNRGPEARPGHVPMMSDLKDSGQVEADADKVVLLHRPDMYEPESDRAGEIDLIVAKHRNGPTKTVTAVMQGHLARIADMAWTPSNRAASAA
jgi:replicative DNA helicase